MQKGTVFAMQKTIKNKGDLLRLISTVLTAFWSCVVGVLFIVQVWRIFSLGAQSFTRASVWEHFSQISLCVWLWIALVVVNAIINALCPAPVKKLRASVDESTIAFRLKNRLSPEKAESVVWKTEKTRFIVGVVCACVCAISFMISVGLLLIDGYTPIAKQGFFFMHQEAERLILAMPFVALACASGIVFAFVKKASYQAEIKSLKAQIASPNTEIVAVKKGFVGKLISVCNIVKGFFKPLNKKTVLCIRVALGVLAVVFIVWGVCNGGMQDVLEKAIVICKQCVGIG